MYKINVKYVDKTQPNEIISHEQNNVCHNLCVNETVQMDNANYRYVISQKHNFTYQVIFGYFDKMLAKFHQ